MPYFNEAWGGTQRAETIAWVSIIANWSILRPAGM